MKLAEEVEVVYNEELTALKEKMDEDVALEVPLATEKKVNDIIKLKETQKEKDRIALEKKRLEEKEVLEESLK